MTTHYHMKSFLKLIILFQCITELYRFLATELYKIVNGLLPDIMKDVFPLNNNLSCNTRNKRAFHSGPIRSVTYGSETLSHLGPKIWELVPTHMKSLQSIALLVLTIFQ